MRRRSGRNVPAARSSMRRRRARPGRGDVEQPQHRAADGRLAAAGFADQRQRLAAVDVERHAIHGPDRCRRLPEAPPQRKVLLQVVDLEERAHAATAPAEA